MSSQIGNYSEQARARLVYQLQHQQGRRLVFLLGSGMSTPAVPDTEQVARMFASRLGEFGSRALEEMGGQPWSTKYQVLAHELGQRQGDASLAEVVKQVVQKACLNAGTVSGVPTRATDWSLTPQHTAFASLYALLDESQRGPIFTTNFDPLIEAALEGEGISATAIAVPGAQTIPIDNIFGVVPVVHLHGYWAQGATLSTAEQLRLDRPAVESMLTRHLSNASVIVLGYGGWEDVFLRALTDLARDGRFAALESELLWMVHGRQDNVPATSILAQLDGTPALRAYYGVDAAALLLGVVEEVTAGRQQSRDAYLGWDPVPRRPEIPVLTPDRLTNFAEGAQPDWSCAKHLPVLVDTSSLINSCDSMAHEGVRGDHVVVAIGPTGEGKSLALLQAGIHMSERHPEITCLLRNPAAGPLTPALISHLRSRRGVTYLFADEADLIAKDALYLVDTAGDQAGRIVWIFALHSHYEHVFAEAAERLNGRLHLSWFDGLDERDAPQIAEAWIRNNVLPSEAAARGAASVADTILSSSAGAQGMSLFGATLHLWAGDGLYDRLDDLLRKLQSTFLRGHSFADLLIAIALVQTAWDPDEESGAGLSLTALGAMCGLASSDVIAVVVRPLGREVGLAQVGDRVYVRHPAIAAAIVAAADDERVSAMAFQIGKAGGHLRSSANSTEGAPRSAYNLWKQLDGELACTAAYGAVYGAANLLEPRVSFMAARRKNGWPGKSRKYGRELHVRGLSSYGDRRYSERGFWIERALAEAADGHREDAVSMAIYALTDMNDVPLTLDQLRYGLVNSIKLARSLGQRGRVLEQVGMDLLARVRGADEVMARVRGVATSGTLLDSVNAFRKASLQFELHSQDRGPWSFRRLLETCGRYPASRISLARAVEQAGGGH